MDIETISHICFVVWLPLIFIYTLTLDYHRPAWFRRLYGLVSLALIVVNVIRLIYGGDNNNEW